MRDLVDELLQAQVRTRLFGAGAAPRLGRLELSRRIGAGAMGTVFAAHDPRLERTVAVKVLHDADDRVRVLREARALGKLAHPNVVAVHDADEVDGFVYIVMELAAGVPLRAWLQSPGAWRAVALVLRQAGAGLAAAHRAGLVHGDIKPDNILVGEDRVQVVDFGLARTDATEDGAGTPSYMAPEVLDGGAPTAASDQFAYAVTFHEALYGTRPHAGSTRAELRASAIGAAPAAAGRSSSPPWLRALLARALDVDPARRFPSLDALLEALDRGLARDRRRVRIVAIGTAALVAGAALGVGLTHGHGEADACARGGERASALWSPAIGARELS